MGEKVRREGERGGEAIGQWPPSRIVDVRLVCHGRYLYVDVTRKFEITTWPG